MIYNFPDGVKLSDIQWSPEYPKNGLAVGVNTSSGGEIYTFDLDELGKIKDNKPKNKYTGFGKIKQLNYKSN